MASCLDSKGRVAEIASQSVRMHFFLNRCNFFGGSKRMMGSKNFKPNADIMGTFWLCTCR